jgi:hypothetical protein
MLLIGLVISFYFTLCGLSLLLINEINQIFVIFHVHTTCRGNFVLKACLFLSLVGGKVSQFLTDVKQRKQEIA